MKIPFLAGLLTRKPAFLSTLEGSITLKAGAYTPLSIESIGPGPRNMPALSVCHYGKLNGDAMRDPEMCFEVEVDGGQYEFRPYYYRNDWVGIEQESVTYEGKIDARLVAEHTAFAQMWFRNIEGQGFHKALDELLAKDTKEGE